MSEPEQFRWVRAAASYADGRGLSGLARQIKPSLSTLRRHAANGLSEGEIYEIHKATGVPLWFLERGWGGWGASEPTEGDLPPETVADKKAREAAGSAESIDAGEPGSAEGSGS